MFRKRWPLLVVVLLALPLCAQVAEMNNGQPSVLFPTHNVRLRLIGSAGQEKLQFSGVRFPKDKLKPNWHPGGMFRCNGSGSFTIDLTNVSIDTDNGNTTLPRQGLQLFSSDPRRWGYALALSNPDTHRILCPLDLSADDGLSEIFRLAISDFPAAVDQFKRMTASLVAPQPAPSPSVAPPQLGKLLITTTPPSAQVYLDDAFRGTSGDDGKLVVLDVQPGSHIARLTALGYNQVKQSITVVAGDNTFALAAERAGPKPLSEPEVEKGLRDGIPKPRVEALIKEYGVNFALTDAVEQQLRAAGADDSVILAIVKNKK